jgi:LysM repeat protein
MRKYLPIFVIILLVFVFTNSVALAGSQQQMGGKIYYVTWGDSLYSIATQHGVTVEAIMRQNGLTDPDFVYVGQALVIPGGGYDHSKGDNMYSCQQYYTVQPGDTLSGIAWAYGTTVNNLLQINNLYNKDFVYVGQKLCVPGSAAPAPMPNHNYNDYDHHDDPKPAPAYNDYHDGYHVVAPGETLSVIAYHYGINHWDIVKVNNLNNASYIWVGQKLIIPSYQHPTPRPSYPGRPGGQRPTPTPQPKPDAGIYLRMGRNVGYEAWGTPEYGLDDCFANWYDDTHPAKRFTAEVLLTNQTKNDISPDWAASENVIFYLASGAHRYACLYRQGSEGQPYNYPELGGHYPRTLPPGGTVDVTYYTHMDKSDVVTKIEFKKFGICFDPNSGDRISCH